MLKPFFIRQSRALVKVNPTDVVGFHTERNYTKIFLLNKKYYLVRTTLSGVLKKVPPGMFIKIHRSLAISIFFIDQIEKDHLLIGDEIIGIPKRCYKSVVEQLVVVE